MKKLNLSSFLQSRFNTFMCRKLGWKITRFYVASLGKFYFFFKRKENKKIKNSVKKVFSKQKNRYEIVSITRGIFRGVLSHYYEKFFNAYSSGETLRTFVRKHIKSTGLEAIKKGLSRGRGVLLITGHVGGVELIPAFLGDRKCPVTIVARFSSARLRSGCIEQADRFLTRIIDADNTPNVMKVIFENLKENRVVITQCDEIDEWRPSPEEKISFLGQDVKLDRTINILSKRVGASIVFGIMHRNNNHGYQFISASIEEMKKQFKNLENSSTGEIILKYLEQYIYNHPEGWYQWKKYPAMEQLPLSVAVKEKPSYAPQLRPSFGKAA